MKEVKVNLKKPFKELDKTGETVVPNALSLFLMKNNYAEFVQEKDDPNQILVIVEEEEEETNADVDE